MTGVRKGLAVAAGIVLVGAAIGVRGANADHAVVATPGDLNKGRVEIVGVDRVDVVFPAWRWSGKRVKRLCEVYSGTFRGMHTDVVTDGGSQVRWGWYCENSGFGSR